MLQKQHLCCGDKLMPCDEAATFFGAHQKANQRHCKTVYARSRSAKPYNPQGVGSSDFLGFVLWLRSSLLKCAQPVSCFSKEHLYRAGAESLSINIICHIKGIGATLAERSSKTLHFFQLQKKSIQKNKRFIHDAFCEQANNKLTFCAQITIYIFLCRYSDFVQGRKLCSMTVQTCL